MRAAVAIAVCASLAVLHAQQQTPLFRGGARFVRVDVYPTDADGRPVENLTADDFELYEDGTRQAIDTFEFVRIEPELEALRVDPNSQAEGEELARDPRARVFGIVLDTGHVSVGGSRELRRPLVDMLDRLIGPRDLFGLITTELPPGSFTLARRTMTIDAMMQKFWTWGTYDQISPQDPVEDLFETCFGSVTDSSRSASITRELVARHRELQTLTFLDQLVDKLAAIREERKFLIVVTQGWRLFTPDEGLLETIANRSGGATPPGFIVERGRLLPGGTPPDARTPVGRMGPGDCNAEAMRLVMMDSQRAHRDLMEKAQRANVAFYPIDPRGLSPFDQPLSHGVISAREETARVSARLQGLRELAENTDGRAFVQSNDMAEQFKQLASSLSTYYLLGYYSTNPTADGRYRSLRVKVNRPGVRLTARRGYFAPTEAEVAAIAEGRTPVAASAADEALEKALGELRDLSTPRELFARAARVDGAIVIQAELGVRARTSPEWADGGELRFMIASGAGDIVQTRPLEPMRSGATLRVPVGPGDVRVEVRARAKGVGDFAAVDTSVVVPTAAQAAAGAATRGGEPLLGDVLAYSGIARALQPAADARYRRTERVTLESPLADGASVAGARILDRTGTALDVPAAARERIDEHGTRWLVATLSLAPFTDGDYVIEMEAEKGTDRARKLFAIRVVR